jgi:hypothetical protein
VFRRSCVIIAVAVSAAVAQAGSASADSAPHPSPTANCIGTANSNGEGEFASSLAKTLPPPEFGQTTAEILGGGLIGTVASSNDCS